MTLREVQCPNCSAPISGSERDRMVCRYCGATLERDDSKPERTCTCFFVTLRVAPSNLEGITNLLVDWLGLEVTAARALVLGSPCEVEVGTDRGEAWELMRAAIERGAEATTESREVAMAPLVDVFLDDSAGQTVKCIAALRRHVTLGLMQAKELVEQAPTRVASNVESEEARSLVVALEALGAKAHIC